MRKLTRAEAEAAQRAYEDEEIDRILSMSDAELTAEVQAAGSTVEQEVAEVDFVIACAIRRTHSDPQGSA